MVSNVLVSYNGCVKELVFIYGAARFRRCALLAVLAFGLVGAADGAQTVTQPFLGVTLYHEAVTSPRPLSLNVAVIDLGAPGLSFTMTPRGPGPPPVANGVADETVIQTPRAFLNGTGAQLAINASYYAISDIHTVNGRSWTNNNGLTASNGDAYSPWLNEPSTDNNYDDALNFSATNRASIVKMPSGGQNGFLTSPSVTPYNTVTGKNRLLQNGVMRAPSNCGNFCDLNPRTAAGLTSGNTKLILMTIDGRNDGISEGVTLVELATFMAQYGATNAINLDGGGSTQMAANYYGDGANAKLVNVPSESERAVGTNLSVFALPNGDFNKSGKVDMADYVLWRKTIGGQLAYDAWRQNYGKSTGTGSGAGGAVVPEPGVGAIVIAGILVGMGARKKRRGRAAPLS
jgi:hypothetical protein